MLAVMTRMLASSGSKSVDSEIGIRRGLAGIRRRNWQS